MPHAVVEELEAIDVDNDNANARSVCGGPGERLFQYFAKELAVGQSREGIVVRSPSQLLLGVKRPFNCGFLSSL